MFYKKLDIFNLIINKKFGGMEFNSRHGKINNNFAILRANN